MRLFSSDTRSSADRPSIPSGRTRRLAALLAALAAVAAAPAGAQLDDVVESQAEADQADVASQERINAIRERTQDAAGRYAQAMAEADSLEQYNEQLSAQVASQEAEIASIEQQLLDIETTTREVQPLMEQMVNALEQFVLLDVPFFRQERVARVENLKDLMARADVSISEKYRLILEAYQIELEYGRTLDSYEGQLVSGDRTRTVEFVQVGRVSLMYRTLDGSETGYWDQRQKTWVVDNSYAEAVEQAINVANDQGAPELLTVPVPAPQEAQS